MRPSKREAESSVRRVALSAVAICGAGAVGFMAGWVQKLYAAYPPSDAASAAGWVQAIGSIGAILGGFGGIILADRFQRRAARQREDDEDESLRLSCLHFADVAMTEVSIRVTRLEFGVLSSSESIQSLIQGEGLRDYARIVETLPLHRFGPRAMHAARDMATSVRHLDQFMRDQTLFVAAGGPAHKVDPADLERAVFYLKQFADGVRSQHRGLKSALGEKQPPPPETKSTDQADGMSTPKMNETSETEV